MGGAVGLAIVWWAIRAFGVTAMDALGFRDPVTTASRITVDGTVLAVTLVVVVGTIVAFGLAPALKATRTDLTRAIKGEGAALFGAGIARSRFRGALVVTQVALSLVLLVAAGVLAHAIRSIAQVEVGFDHEHVLVIDARPSLVGYDSVRADAFGEELVRRAAALPSVRAAARAATAPFEAVWGAQVRAIGPAGSQAREPTLGQINFVTPGYFGVLGIPILLGRTFTNDERASSEPVAVVSETLARLLWPGGDALGARISWDDKLPPATVVGIVRDARQMRLGTAQRPMIYAPLTPRSGARASDPVVLLRTDADPRLVIPAVRAIVRAVDPAMYAAAFPLRSVLENSDAARAARTVSASTLALGVFALFLTAVGLYGVVSFAVAQRTREIGIRMALGAGATDVVRAALAQVSRFVAIGAVIGLGGSLAATSAMRSLLLGIRPMDPAVFGGVALLLGAVAVVATWIPARRATQVDPLVALRHE